MISSSLATNLLGRRVQLHEPPAGAATDTGRVATVYFDARGMHYVVLLDGRLVEIEDGGRFTVLEDSDW